MITVSSSLYLYIQCQFLFFYLNLSPKVLLFFQTAKKIWAKILINRKTVPLFLPFSYLFVNFATKY